MQVNKNKNDKWYVEGGCVSWCNREIVVDLASA